MFSYKLQTATRKHCQKKMSLQTIHTLWRSPLCRRCVRQTHCVSVQQQVVKDSGLGWGRLVAVFLIRYVHYVVPHLTALNTQTHFYFIGSGWGATVVRLELMDVPEAEAWHVFNIAVVRGHFRLPNGRMTSTEFATSLRNHYERACDHRVRH